MKCCVLFALLGCLSLSPALAEEPARCSTEQDPKEFVKECRTRAEALVQAGSLAEALAIYQQAYREVPTPRLLWPMAQLHLSLRHPDEGLAVLERYLKEVATEEVPAEQGAQVEEMRRRFAELKQELAEPPPLPLIPEVTIVARPLPPPRRSLRPALGMVIGGGAALLVGISLGVGAIVAAQEVNGGERFNEGLHLAGHSLQDAGIALDVIGGLTATVGVAWILWLRRHPYGEHHHVALLPAGSGLALTGSF